MIHPLAGVLVPELWWDASAGFAPLEALIADALEIGVGGFVIRGGPADAVQALARDLRRSTAVPLLLGAEVEAGVGEHFGQATPLPPVGALGALRDPDAFRRAAKLTARELRGLGLSWALAPIASLARPASDGAHAGWLGARAAGEDAQRVAEWLVDWVDACQGEAVLACARGFPGAGRAAMDPWAPDARAGVTVAADAGTLWADDLVPFRALTDAGVASLGVSAVAYPGMDRSGVPACHSAPLLTAFLREELRYEGLIVAEEVAAPAAVRDGAEGASVVAAVRAGCDLVLAPRDLDGALTALEAANAAGALDGAALEASRARRAFWAAWAEPRDPRQPTLDEVLWARQVADLVVHPVRGVLPELDGAPEVVVLDEASRGPWAPPAGAAFLAALQAVGRRPQRVDAPGAEGRGPLVIALFGGANGDGAVAWAPDTLVRIGALHAAVRARQRSTVVVAFTSPARAAGLPEGPHVVCAWSEDRAMQEAAARRLG